MAFVRPMRGPLPMTDYAEIDPRVTRIVRSRAGQVLDPGLVEILENERSRGVDPTVVDELYEELGNMAKAASLEVEVGGYLSPDYADAIATASRVASMHAQSAVSAAKPKCYPMPDDNNGSRIDSQRTLIITLNEKLQEVEANNRYLKEDLAQIEDALSAEPNAIPDNVVAMFVEVETLSPLETVYKVFSEAFGTDDPNVMIIQDACRDLARYRNSHEALRRVEDVIKAQKGNRYAKKPVYRN